MENGLNVECSKKNKKNIWGISQKSLKCKVEGGAAVTVHWCHYKGGTLTTTFTASQDLLLNAPKYV